MKSATIIALLASMAAAAPSGEYSSLEKRQGGTTSNDLNGPCKKVTFIFARGSTETGNMGETVGPKTCSQLKAKMPGDVACQGVGGGYTAGLATNADPGGTSPGAISASEQYFNQAHTKCPQTIIVGGGYSQGAAVMTRSIPKLSDAVRSQIAGVVLYGDTQNKQTGGSIPDFPKSKVKVFCNSSDGVCGGALMVTAGHLAYGTDVPAAVTFLQQAISQSGSGGGAAMAGGDDSSSAGASSSGMAGGDGSSSGGASSGMSGLGGASGGGLGSLGGASSGGSSLGGLGGGSSSGLGSLGGSSLGGLGGASSAGSSDSGSDSGTAGGASSGLGSLGGASSGLGGLGSSSSSMGSLGGLGSKGMGGF